MTNSVTDAALSDGSHWEPVYGRGEQLNRYPFDAVITFVFSAFGKVSDRSQCRLLEVGCGAGNNVWFMAREGFSAAGIDGSNSAIDYARERLAKEGLSADLRVGNFAHLPWDDQSVDGAIDRGAITHNRRADIENTLDEIKRVLKPHGLFFSQFFSWEDGGRLLGRDLGDGCYGDFTGGYFENVGRTFFADRDMVEELFGSRFEIVSAEHVTFDRDATEKKAAFWNLICRRTG